MKTKRRLAGIISILIFFGLMFISNRVVIAAEGCAQVYKKDPMLTPHPEEVTLQDLDGSGYLKNAYLSLLIKKGSPYDYPAYSSTGNFWYKPVQWDYNHISPEGIRFDSASVYYYLTAGLSRAACRGVTL